MIQKGVTSQGSYKEKECTPLIVKYSVELSSRQAPGVRFALHISVHDISRTLEMFIPCLISPFS